MGTLGTSVGLQGQYKNDYLENLQLQEQKRGNLTNELFRQQEAERKQNELAQKAMEDAVTIPKGRFLPQREEELKNDTLKLLMYSTDKQSKNPMYNPQMDSEFQKRKIDLASKAKTYETERMRAEKDVDEMVRNQSIYDPRGIEEGLAVLNGEVPFSEAMKGRLYQVPKVKDFSKFTDLGKHIETAGFLDTVNKQVQRVDAKGNKYFDSVKGYDFSTPEKEKEQFGKALEYVQSTRNNPYIQRLVADAEKQVIENAPNQGIDLESTQDEVFNGMVDNLVAKKIIETAKNDIKNQVKDIDTPAAKGLSFNNNFRATGGGGATGKVFNIGDPINQPLYEKDPTTKKPIMEKPLVKNGSYFSIQSVTSSENAPKVVLSGRKGAVVQGVVRNEDNGKPEYAKVLIPETKTKGRVRKGDEARETYIKLTDTDISDIRTNIGADQYDATIGNWTKKESIPSKAAPKAITQDEFNKKWSSLKKGETLVAPNGVTYKKK